WDPLLRLKESRHRDALIEASRQALKPGASLEQARRAAQDLAWAVALFHGDRELSTLLLWAAYYQLPLAPAPAPGPAGAGLRATAVRCGLLDQADGPLLAALASSGALDPVQGIRAFNTILSADPRDPYFRLADALQRVAGLRIVGWMIHVAVGDDFKFWPPDNPAVLGAEAFIHLTIRPNEVARQIPAWLDQPGPVEQERSRLAELAVAKAWTDGVTEAAKVLDSQPDDPWLALVRARLGQAAAANGLEQAPITAAVHTALLQAGAGTDPDLPDHGRNPSRGMGWYEQQWEGRYTLENSVIYPRVDFQHSLEAWAAAEPLLPRASAIEPPLAPDGSLAPLSGALALLANAMAAELPAPLWSSQAASQELEGLDAFRPGAPWSLTQSAELESRLDADGRVEGRIVPKGRGFSLALRLVRQGLAGPWVQRTFQASQSTLAPGWMAGQALRLRGLAVAGPDQAALARRWFAKAADLAEFAAGLDGSKPVYGSADGTSRLAARNPGVWLQARATTDLDPPERWAALAKALQAEPWHPHAQARLAHYLHGQVGPKSCLNQYLEALRWAPGNLEVLRACADDLEHTGFIGERLLLAETALSVTARAPTALVFAAEMQESWTWNWRAGNYGEATSPFGWSCYRLGSQKQLALAQEAVRRDPSYGQGYLRLLKAEQGLTATAADMDGIVDAALKADPGQADCLEFRLFDLQPRWHGSEDAMLAFAHKYQAQDWDLVMKAHDELAYMQDDAAAYRGSPEVWKEVGQIFR
ncbi:MAG TPA: hypothetical protein VNZ54_08715, partial [bacterium]|nr:hypothetical protein [bacterium]